MDDITRYHAADGTMPWLRLGIVPITIVFFAFLPLTVIASSSKYMGLGLKSEFRIGTDYLQGDPMSMYMTLMVVQPGLQDTSWTNLTG